LALRSHLLLVEAHALALLATVALSMAASSAFPAAASDLDVTVTDLHVEVDDASMCDRNVVVTPTQVPLGVLISVTVSSISTDCNGWTLRVRVTNSANTPLGSELTTVVDQTSELLPAPNIALGGSFNIYYAFQPSP
jgi:hypothetical protein